MSKSSNALEKQSTAEQIEAQENKVSVETPVVEARVPIPSVADAAQPKFLSAATMIASIPEISDEELLQLALELERKHGI